MSYLVTFVVFAVLVAFGRHRWMIARDQDRREQLARRWRMEEQNRVFRDRLGLSAMDATLAEIQALPETDEVNN